MYGAAFTISAKNFWELQPDAGLLIYGADQLEMSFKVNLCGGVLYEAVCSRVAHLYRRFPYMKHQSGFDYKARSDSLHLKYFKKLYCVFFLETTSALQKFG